MYFKQHNEQFIIIDKEANIMVFEKRKLKLEQVGRLYIHEEDTEFMQKNYYDF